MPVRKKKCCMNSLLVKVCPSLIRCTHSTILRARNAAPRPAVTSATCRAAPVPSGTGVLDAAGDRPRAGEQEDRVEDPERERERRLRLEEGSLVLGPGVEVDAEVGGEDEGLEDDEEPHVGFTGEALDLVGTVARGVVWKRLDRGHEVAASTGGRARRHTSGGGSGSGPVPRSSRWIRLRSR